LALALRLLALPISAGTLEALLAAALGVLENRERSGVGGRLGAVRAVLRVLIRAVRSVCEVLRPWAAEEGGEVREWPDARDGRGENRVGRREGVGRADVEEGSSLGL